MKYQVKIYATIPGQAWYLRRPSGDVFKKTTHRRE